MLQTQRLHLVHRITMTNFDQPPETNVPRLHLQTTRGWLKRLAKSPKMSKVEREAHTTALQHAREKALAGDESEFRRLTDVRWCAECLVSGAGFSAGARANTPFGRRRKYSNPLFMTPHGLINTYPEIDDDLFLSEEQAHAALVRAGLTGAWELRETLFEMEMRDKRYLRWEQEVKGTDFQEIKRSLEEVSIIYLDGGRAALRKLYTREHVAKLLSKMRAHGVEHVEVRQWNNSPSPRP